MYVPETFVENDQQRIAVLVEQHPFATLISVGPDGPLVSHLPLLAVPGPSGTLADGRLLGHLARANPHANLLTSVPALAIFHGPHAYVSPRWYATPGVPTWNYANVHITGKVRICERAEDGNRILETLTRAFEPDDGSAWSLHTVADQLDRLRTAIVAFEISITGIQAKFKLSQNRPTVEQQAIATALNNTHPELAALMH